MNFDGKLISLVLFLFLASFADVGDLPEINTCTAEPFTHLDFTLPGIAVPIARFTINCNLPTGFDLTFQFTNICRFVKNGQEIPMTALVLTKISGTLGNGLAEPDNLDILGGLVGNSFTWDPGATQTTETIDFVVELRASWADPVSNRKLARIYQETITFEITAGL